MTQVVNKKRERYDVYIGRPGPYGNPFEIGRDGTRAEVVRKHREWLKRKVSSEPAWAQELRETMTGKRLGCFCKPLACHGDNYVKFLENRLWDEEH